MCAVEYTTWGTAWYQAHDLTLQTRLCLMFKTAVRFSAFCATCGTTPSTPTGGASASKLPETPFTLIRRTFTGATCLRTATAKRACPRQILPPIIRTKRPVSCRYCCGACVSKLPLLIRYHQHAQVHPAVQLTVSDAAAATDCSLPAATYQLPDKSYMPQPHVEAWMKPGYWQVDA